MSGLKILAVALIAPGAIALVTSAYLVQFTKSDAFQNYVQFAGFAAIAIGVVLWHIGSSKQR